MLFYNFSQQFYLISFKSFIVSSLFHHKALCNAVMQSVIKVLLLSSFPGTNSAPLHHNDWQNTDRGVKR